MNATYTASHTINSITYVSQIIESYDSRTAITIVTIIYDLFIDYLFPQLTALFLDYDGVLHGRQGTPKEVTDRFDNFLRSHPKIVIVFSSDRRRGKNLQSIREQFAKYYFSTRIIDTTVNFLKERERDLLSLEEDACLDPETMINFQCRGAYIRHYLEKHPCGKYIIFDDIPLQNIFPTAIQVDPNTLLTDADIAQSKTFLALNIDRVDTELDTPLPSNKQCIIHKMLEKYQIFFPTVEATLVLANLAKHKAVDSLAIQVIEKLNVDQRAAVIFHLLKKKTAYQWIPFLFHPDFGTEQMAEFLLVFAKTKEAKLLIEQVVHSIAFNKKIQIVFLLKDSKENYFILKNLLSTMRELDSETKSKLLLNVIGIEAMTLLVLKNQPIEFCIKQIVADQRSQDLEELIVLLLVNNECTRWSKGKVFVHLSQKENSDSELAKLLEEIDTKDIAEGLIYLSQTNRKYMIKAILCWKLETPCIENGRVLVNLTKQLIQTGDAAYFELMKILLQRYKIASDDKDRCLELLADCNGMDAIMVFLLQDHYPKLFIQSKCLRKIADRKIQDAEDGTQKKIIQGLMRSTTTTAEEREDLLVEFTQKVRGSRTALTILQLLISDSEDEEKVEPLAKQMRVSGWSKNTKKGQACVHLAHRYADTTDLGEMHYLEEMILLLLKKDLSPEERDRVFLNVSKNMYVTNFLIFLTREYGISSDAKALTAKILIQEGKDTRLLWYLKTFGSEIDLFERCWILNRLREKENTDHLVAELMKTEAFCKI